MQCVTPMFRLYDITTGDTKRILSRKEVMEGLAMNPNNIRFQLSKMNSRYLAKNQLIQTIPCQKCYACRLNYSAEWATKNMLETLEHEHCYFITLTYNDENLPKNGSLNPADVTRMIHHMRVDGYKIRYFYCGEYGSENKRPHYHMLLYGLPLDLSQNYHYRIDNNFKEHWCNPLINKYWKKGFHDIAAIEWSSAAYVSRYCMKKLNDEPKNDKWYEDRGIIKEFIRMSRRPGIGRHYYDLHKLDIYKNDSMVMKTVKGNTGQFKPPKSFDKLFKEEYPEEFKKIQKHRKECAERARKNTYKISNYTDLEQLESRMENISIKANMLKREL